MPYPTGESYKTLSKGLENCRHLFPNARALAEFHPNSFTLHFHYLSKENYKLSRSHPASSADRNNLEIVDHELTHWSDQISSVWGCEYTISLFEAYNGSTGLEHGFFKTVDFFDQERRVLLPLYYHVVEKEARLHSVDDRWIIEFSSGQEFDSYGYINPKRPIFFVAFLDSKTGARVARQPITVGSLLETTATYAEILAGLAFMERMDDEERIVEKELFLRERLEPLYDPLYTIYTAPVHMLSRFSGISDLILAYEKAAAVAHVALNMVPYHFDALCHPRHFAPFGERRKAFNDARDRGYAYAVMARHSEKLDSSKPTLEWLNELLTVSGLPNYGVILSDAKRYIIDIRGELQVNSPIDEVRDFILKTGMQRFDCRQKCAFRDGAFDPLSAPGEPLPLMFDSNGDLFSAEDKAIGVEDFDPEFMYFNEWRLRDFTDNFLQGCRGLSRR